MDYATLFTQILEESQGIMYLFTMPEGGEGPGAMVVGYITSAIDTLENFGKEGLENIVGQYNSIVEEGQQMPVYGEEPINLEGRSGFPYNAVVESAEGDSGAQAGEQYAAAENTGDDGTTSKDGDDGTTSDEEPIEVAEAQTEEEPKKGKINDTVNSNDGSDSKGGETRPTNQ